MLDASSVCNEALLIEQPADAASRNLRILVVDDNQEYAELIQMMLAIEGYHPEICTDSVEAAKRLETEPPDLLILDLIMPRMNGLDLLELVKSRPRTAKLPVIFTTAAPSLAERALAHLGSCQVLPKPFDVSDLYTFVETARRAGLVAA